MRSVAQGSYRGRNEVRYVTPKGSRSGSKREPPTPPPTFSVRVRGLHEDRGSGKT
jgi:hypothetical protein